jgi:hypothetical protein
MVTVWKQDTCSGKFYIECRTEMPAPDKKYMVHFVHNYVSIYLSVIEPKQGNSPNTLKITRSICKPFDKLWRGK